MSHRPCAIVGVGQTHHKSRRLDVSYGGLVREAVFRALDDSPSTRIAAVAAGLREAPVEVAELQAAFTHEELLLRRVLELGENVVVNASGGPLASNPIMASGLARIGYAADHIFGEGRRALAHATSGPCLQQNLICILEGDS